MEHELEAITERLLKLEAALSVQREANDALRVILYRSLGLLHERGTLALQDLVAGLKSRSAFAQATLRQHPSQILLAEIAALQGIADAYAEQTRSQLPPQDESDQVG